MNSIQLRAAREEDLVQSFEWISEPEVMKARFKQNKIQFNEHQEWFLKRLKDPDTQLYIITNSDSEDIGLVRCIRKNAQIFELSIVLSKVSRGRGHAANALQLAIKDLHDKYSTKTFIAQIRKDNPASQIAFAKAGFKIFQEISIEGIAGIEMRYDAN